MKQQKLTGLCLALIYIMDGTISLVCIIEIPSAPTVYNAVVKCIMYLLINNHFICNSARKRNALPTFSYSVYALYV